MKHLRIINDSSEIIPNLMAVYFNKMGELIFNQGSNESTDDYQISCVVDGEYFDGTFGGARKDDGTINFKKITINDVPLDLSLMWFSDDGGVFYSDEEISVNEGDIVKFTLNDTTEIPESAFFNMRWAKNMEIKDGVTTLGADSFNYHVYPIILPSSIIHIGRSVFFGCNFTNITFTGTIEQWESIETDKYWNGM